MTVACPELLVVPLVAERLPVVLLQATVFPDRATLSASFRVTVNVVEFSEVSAKLDGVMERTVFFLDGVVDGGWLSAEVVRVLSGELSALLLLSTDFTR